MRNDHLTGGRESETHIGYPEADWIRASALRPDHYLLSIIAVDSRGESVSLTFDLTSRRDLADLRGFAFEFTRLLEEGLGDLGEAVLTGTVQVRP